MLIRISSRDNQLIKNTVKLKNKASFRKKNELFVIEGARLTQDALLSKVSIQSFICSDTGYERYPELTAELQKNSQKSYIVSDSLFSEMSDTVTPQGLMCICRFCNNVIYSDDIAKPMTALALENIQDPSNMGTILRTAEAIGIERVYLTSDCVDIYSPKVLRGSMGAVFRQKIYITDDMVSLVKDCNSNGINTIATVPIPTALPITQIKSFKNTFTVIGNEGNGITHKLLDVCKTAVTIPMQGRAESLNASAAAAIVIWEAGRPR